jgi:putative transposase
MEKTIWWKGGSTYHRNLYHIVFVPKYRRKVLQRELVQRLHNLFYECTKLNKWYIHELQILPDHIHILIQLPPSISVSKAVQYLKGGSSKVIRKEFPELKEFLWGDSLWQDGFFSETVGRANESTIRKYIREQWQSERKNTSHGL